MSEEFHVNSKKIGLEFFSAPNAIARQALKDSFNQELSVSFDGPCYFLYLKDCPENDSLGMQMRMKLDKMMNLFAEAKDCLLVGAVFYTKFYHFSAFTDFFHLFLSSQGFTFPMITYLKFRELSLILAKKNAE